jgi:hypothetical protein
MLISKSQGTRPSGRAALPWSVPLGGVHIRWRWNAAALIVAPTRTLASAGVTPRWRARHDFARPNVQANRRAAPMLAKLKPYAGPSG